MTTIGVGIAHDRVSAICIRRGQVRWAIARHRDEATALGDTLGALFSECPTIRYGHARAAVAVGPSAVQLKRLGGLPQMGDPRALAAVIRENAGRYFLRSRGPLITSGVRIVAPGIAWAAAFDEPVITEIERACRAARLRVRVIVPTCIALQYVVEMAELVWIDGPASERLSFAGGTLTGIRRRGAAECASCTPVALEALGCLGRDGSVCIDAYAALRTGRRENIVLRHRSGATPRPIPTRRRWALASLTCALGITWAMIAPGWAAARMASRARTIIALRGADVRRAVEAERRLARATDALRQIEELEGAATPPLLLLAQLARALPDSSMIAELQVDSTNRGRLTAIAPRARLAVEALERVPAISRLTIVGPVTQEVVAGRTVERVTVNFDCIPAVVRP